MEEQSTKTITEFDSLFTTNRIQLLKILLPRLAPDQQNVFAVYIKLLELQYTLSLLRRHPTARMMGDRKQLSADFIHGDNSGTMELLDEMLPFSGPKERARIENIKNMIMNLKKMQEMMEMIQMLQEMFPEGTEGDSPLDMFAGMSDSGLASILQMFGGDQKE